MDYEEKYALAESKVESVSFENAFLADQVTKLTADFVKAQDGLSMLEKDLKTEKAFCALKDKQLEVTLGKFEEAQVQSMVDFKKSDKYKDKLCALYVEGFDLVYTYMKKHHPEIDLSKLDIEEKEREVVVDRAMAENANDAIDEEIDASTDDLVDLAQP